MQQKCLDSTRINTDTDLKTEGYGDNTKIKIQI